MLFKTKGIVLSYIKYKETSIIIKIYTESFGLQSYIVNGVRSQKSKIGIALFQPLTILDLVVYHKENRSLHRISEVKCFTPFKSIPFEIRKSTISMFLCEVLNKTLKEESPNQPLFEFLMESFLYLDEATESYQNFHLQFLIHYSAFLGFSPSHLKDVIGNEEDLIEEEEKVYFNKLIKSDYNEVLPITNKMRRKFLGSVLKFFKQHVENFGEVNSEKILSEILK